MAVAVSQVSMGDENVRNLHAFFTPRDGLNEESSELQDRRKRQRTASPVREPSLVRNNIQRSNLGEWESQLKAAAYGVTSSGTSDTISTSQYGQTLYQATGGVLVDKRLDCHLPGLASSVEDVTPNPKGPVHFSGANTMDQSASTHPKKMLTIRPDGKLASPKVRSNVTDLSSRKKRAPSKSQSAPVKRLVVIKYGFNDESRICVAQKIEKILSDLKEKPSSKSDIDAKLPKPVGPPKSTHPFFLGTARISDQVAHLKGILNESETRDHQDTDTSFKKQNSPRKSIVNASAWTGLMGAPGVADHSKFSRFPGAVEPLWPPQGMIHVRPQIDSSMTPIRNGSQTSQMSRGCRKLKYANVQISEHEDILRPYNELANGETSKIRKTDYQRSSTFRQPQRRIMTGSKLQSMICNSIDPILSFSSSLEQTEGQNIKPNRSQTSQPHIALSHVFNQIPNSLTAFDKFEWETQDWVHKYAPKRADEVLQHGREAIMLRDWLRGHTITSVEGGSGETSKKRDTSTAFKRFDGSYKRKKRKKAEELDGFVISDGEESDQMDELANPDIHETELTHGVSPKKSVIRAGDIVGQANGERATNAVVLSGPHGCGKTAAVYAVANELNFEVFEINAGSKRSGKDILDRVGDMTRNHLVNRPRGTEEIEKSKESTNFAENDSEPGQDTINYFFQPRAEIRKKAKGRPKKQSGPPKAEDIPRKPKSQKQSVILLEEVDVLFEEDKQFWPTTLDLILHSKRPIIMTCSDESLLPLDEMHLFAILRFTPPPERLAVDYLLLIACNEGHLLSRHSISALLNSKSYDLRASIMDLNFFCQMAIGDTKGGLEWMLIDSSHEYEDEKEKPRVVSENTYLEGMGSLKCERQDLGWETVDHLSCWQSNTSTSGSPSRTLVLEKLEALEKSLDTISAADIHPCPMFRHESLAMLDTNLPGISERSRLNYVDGSTLVEAEQVDDPSGIGASLILALNNLARRLCSRIVDMSKVLSPSDEAAIPKSITRTSLLAATNPIARPPKTPFIPQKAPLISSFDGPTSIITEDLAPYLRTIVFSDMKLEEQRARLTASLSNGGLTTGRKMRTTRASRAALEGGSKAHTRRERWFPGTTNSIFAPILRLGGDGWQELSWQQMLKKGGGEAASSEKVQEHSRRSSVEDLDE